MSTGLIWLTLATTTVGIVHGFGDGAPKEACQSLQPDHAKVRPQDPAVAPLPYRVEAIDATTFEPNQIISIRIRAEDGAKFRGFFLQARDDGGQGQGQFLDGSVGSKIFTCFNKDDSVTHKWPQFRTEMTFQWKAPSNPDVGPIHFRGTIAETMLKYWTDIDFIVHPASTPDVTSPDLKLKYPDIKELKLDL